MVSLKLDYGSRWGGGPLEFAALLSLLWNTTVYTAVLLQIEDSELSVPVSSKTGFGG